MAAPAYKWDWVTNLYGFGPPSLITLEAAASLETVVGTLVAMSSGQVAAAGASAASICGLAAEETAAALSAADPIRVYILRPGDVIKGTADADASALSGFAGKTQDLNADGSLDVGDTANGCFSVYRTEDSGVTVYIIPTEFDHGCVN